MEQPADRDIFTKFVEAIDRGLGLQDFHLDAVLGQKLQGIGTDLQVAARSLVRAQRFLRRVRSTLERRRAECQVHGVCPSHASPTPVRRREDLGILKRRMAFNLYVAPGKMRDTWGIRFSLAHDFNRKEFALSD